MDDRVLERIYAILLYQFNDRVADALINGRITYRIVRGDVREVYRDGELILVRRPTDGLFSISLVAGELIQRAEKPPGFRIVVRGDREIRGSVLARDVVGIDENLRPGDEVVIVDEEDRLVGVGRLRVPPIMLNGLERGEVARVRKRVKR
ncbi:MAG: hypothetical protein F7C08_02355 [Desulfurococcales archaeon]|nr:hypothetical protein [Desulfurococcales archaeon]MCE4605361.1 hypothetical protein [Desulfurococcales archaeon]